MSLIHIDEMYCKGCGLCISACPKNIITISNNYANNLNSRALFDNSNTCTGCSLCAQMCPDVAISVFKD